MIDGVMTKKLRVIPDERGRLMECLRNDDDLFIKFGQLYMTTTFPGVVKGWHLHHAQWDNIVCVKGMIKLVLYDESRGLAHQGADRRVLHGRAQPAAGARAARESSTAGSASAPKRPSSSTRRPRSTSTTTPDQDELPHDTDRSPTTGACGCARRAAHAAPLARRPADGCLIDPRRP